MKVGFLITARLKSSRLRLKLLLPLNGFSVIERVIQRAKRVHGCDATVLCTSTKHQDLPLVDIARKLDIYYFNGDAEDVLARLLKASLLYNFDYFVGITADNPLFSLYHANLIVDHLKKDPEVDYLYTNGLPLGANIYAVNVRTLKIICEIKEQIDTEIWGYLINRPEVFNVKEMAVNNEFQRPQYRLTMDEFEDYQMLKNVFENFNSNEIIDLLDVYKYLDQHPQIAAINKEIKQKSLDNETKKSIDTFFKKNFDKISRLKSIYGSR